MEDVHLDLECIIAEKPVVTYLSNLCIPDLKKKNHRLKRLNVCDENATEAKLSNHVILGAADFQRIKTTEAPIFGPSPDEDLVAEFISLGWIISDKGTTPCPQAF